MTATAGIRVVVFGFFVQVSGAALAQTTAASAQDAEDGFRTRIEAHAAVLNRFGASQIGIQVSEVDSGRLLVAIGQDRLMHPASNVKLLTTAAAIKRLTPQYRFRTFVQADAFSGEVLSGNLYLKGFGDPLLMSETLELLASDVASRGLRRVSGRLVVDDSYLDGQRFPPGYAGVGEYDEDFTYRAPTGAVSLNFNAIRILINPTRPGQPARVSVEPASDYVTISSKVQTVRSGGNRIAVSTSPTAKGFVVNASGRVSAGSDSVERRRRITDPALFAGAVFKASLARYGVSVAGEVARGRAPDKAPVLASWRSESLGVIARTINKYSQNFMAEQLLKVLGAEQKGTPGTTAKGLAVVTEYLKEIGIPRGSFKLENGSGMGQQARVTPAQIVEVLRAMWRDLPIANEYVGSLPVAGADGTLGSRMGAAAAKGHVRAKTGTLTGVLALSGYALGQGRPPVAFSILIANVPTGVARGTADAIAAEIAAHVRDQSVSP